MSCDPVQHNQAEFSGRGCPDCRAERVEAVARARSTQAIPLSEDLARLATAIFYCAPIEAQTPDLYLFILDSLLA